MIFSVLQHTRIQSSVIFKQNIQRYVPSVAVDMVDSLLHATHTHTHVVSENEHINRMNYVFIFDTDCVNENKTVQLNQSICRSSHCMRYYCCCCRCDCSFSHSHSNSQIQFRFLGYHDSEATQTLRSM